MSTNYGVILAVGKQFENDEEVIEFIQSFGTQAFSEEDFEQMDDLGLEDFFYSNDYFSGLDCETINYFTGYGRVLGYRLSIRPPEAFAENVKEAQAKFKAHFGIEGDIISTVQVS